MNGRLLIDAKSFLGKVWNLARPYWSSEERWTARGLLAAIVALTLGIVYMSVLLNEFSRDFYNAIQEKNYEDFHALLLYFCLLAAGLITLSVYKLYLTQMLEMRWRSWLTTTYLSEWLERQVYYRLELASRGTDNPDQRIAEDARLFTSGTLSLSLGLLSSVVTLASFVVILWGVSGPLDVTVAGMTISIPGYMVWVAILYAVAGSVITHYVGRPLIGLNFQQERFEADFRFNLVRLRENAEGVALYRGEASERRGLLERFDHVRSNWWELMRYTKRLTTATAGYSQVAIVFPILVAAPRYFSGAIQLGGLMQISSAFGQVQGALSWFVDSYGSIANWKASVDRLLTFHRALDETHAEAEHPAGIRIEESPADTIASDDLDINLPDGSRLLTHAAFNLTPGERVLLTGPSGSGKSTLFRSIAGIWPFGSGKICLPAGAKLMFLPQKPYIPIGTLREAVSYPAEAGSFSDKTIGKILEDVRLAPFAHRLEESRNWSLAMSLGEQQRLAVARALLHRPKWLFLDEATASLDEALESHLYALIAERLPGTTIMSIAHRPNVAAYHDRRLSFTRSGETTTLALA